MFAGCVGIDIGKRANTRIGWTKMISLDRYNEVKRQIERLKKEAARAEGVHSQLMKQLKDEFGVETLDEAKTLLAKLSKEADKAEAEFEKTLNEFEEEWGDRL
jgi:predicted transcriptional regulator